MNSCPNNLHPYPDNPGTAEVICRDHILKIKTVWEKSRKKVRGKWRSINVEVKMPVGYFGPHRWTDRKWDSEARVWRDRCERCGAIRVWNLDGTAYWNGKMHVLGDPSLANYLERLIQAK